MATHRAGFEPEDVDSKNGIVTSSEKPYARVDTLESHASTLGESYEIRLGDEKATDLGIATGTSVHDVEHLGDGRPSVDTPGEIITQVLAVEDDPSLNPWTFRMWFLGKYAGMPLRSGHSLDHQESASPSLAPSSPPSITSSLRRSPCPSSSWPSSATS